MTGTLMAASHRPADTKLSDALVAAKEEDKAQDGYSKVATLVKAPDPSDADTDTGATMRPTEEQLKRINQFTKKVVTADEVVAFKTLSCNDLPDRDDDRFTTECVKGFAELPQPFSPIGKSFLIDHNYSMGAAKGRIFGAGIETISGATFLTNEVYIPNTPKNADYIEDIDFGVAWAVSVGVMLGKKTCSVCGENFYYWFCEEGHEKGLYYEKDGDRDKYGWPVAVDPKKRKGAVKCVRNFDDPRDMYELSQVILGAQYGAQLADKLPMEALAKSAKDLGIPTIGLSQKEADEIPFKHEPKRVSDARRMGLVKQSDDGSLVWVEDGMVFTYDPENPDEGVSSLGRATNQNKEASDGERGGEVPGSEGSDGAGVHDAGDDGEGDGSERSVEDHPAAELEQQGGESGSPGSLSKDEDGDDTSEGEGDDDAADPSEDADPEDDDEEGETDPESSGADDPSQDTEKEKAVTKKAVMAFAQAHKSALSESVVDAIEAAPGNGLDVLVDGFSKRISELENEKKELAPKAELGDAYLKDLRKEALDWYVKARQSSPEDKVSIDSFERLLDLASGDSDLLKSMIEEQKELAQAKFPKSVRRSSFPSDPNVSAGVGGGTDKSGDEKEDDEEAKRARRRHG